jgi:GT2 family glycosyltransferase
MPSHQSRKVTVIIPTWKRGDLLRKCLESLRAQKLSDFEIIIVSNGAGDWAQELAREFACMLVRFVDNRGFAAAVNAGIETRESPYVMVLNDDAELNPDWLEKAVATLEEHPDISFCSGKIYKSDGHVIDDAGDALSMGGGAWRLGHGRADAPEFDRPRLLFAVSLTAGLFRRSVFEKIGLLDENFISYLEDMDFSIRSWRAGLRGVYLPAAVARHHGGASLNGGNSRERFRLMTRNQLALLAKNYPAALWLRLALRIKWAQMLWFGMALRQRMVVPYLTGLWQFLGLLRRMPSARPRWSRDERRIFLDWLRDSERVIYEDISVRPRAEQDTYWRLYFALFRPPNPTVSAERAPAERGTEGLPRRQSK